MESFCTPSPPIAAASPPLSTLILQSSTATPALTSSSSMTASMTQDDLKQMAAYKAVELVESNMVLGLGTGSTAYHALERIGALLRCGKLTNIVGIPTSKKTEAHALSLGIPLTTLASNPIIDLSIDGADEVDPHLNLVKGRGGSLLREKMIEGASKKFVVIVDDSKLVDRIGASKLAVPVEVIPFGWEYTLSRVKSLFDDSCTAKLRTKSPRNGIVEEVDEPVPFETDNFNFKCHGRSAPTQGQDRLHDP